MKFVKGIGLFFIYPLVMFCLGIYTGVAFEEFFYPGAGASRAEQEQVSGPPADAGQNAANVLAPSREQPRETADGQGADAVETVLKEEVLTADTEYVLEEVDVRTGTSVETAWPVPEKYIGMNRERFLEAMGEYELSPPLSELERGFVGLEVLNFSARKVVVRMNYAYVEPSSSFYLGVADNYVVVFLDDKETVYIETDILLEQLPDEVQQEIIRFLYVEDEEALYNFLESYSS